jgi:hypothetical protein
MKMMPPPTPDETPQAMAVVAATVPPVTQADMPDATQIIMPPFPISFRSVTNKTHTTNSYANKIQIVTITPPI